jgi:hypothetical protein
MADLHAGLGLKMNYHSSRIADWVSVTVTLFTHILEVLDMNLGLYPEYSERIFMVSLRFFRQMQGQHLYKATIVCFEVPLAHH